MALNAPLTLSKNKPICRNMRAKAPSCQPHNTQSTLLNINVQKPQQRLSLDSDATNHADKSVITMAGHCKNSMNASVNLIYTKLK